MVKINKRLLPIKAHFLFFMGAMGPILPQLSVLGKEVGIAPEVMGYITSVLPIMYVVAKPLFGFLVDFFSNKRKLIFMSLILVMTLAYGTFYFLPAIETATSIDQSGSPFYVVDYLENCRNMDLRSQDSFVKETTRYATCSTNSSTFEVQLLTVNNTQLSIEVQTTESPATSNNNNFLDRLNACVLSNTTNPLLNSPLKDLANITCHLTADPIQTVDLYRTSGFWLYVLLMCTGTIGFNVINSISDAICFDVLGESEEDKYGAQRVWGTIGFGLTALLAGVAVNVYTLDSVKSFTPALVIMFVFSGLDLLSVLKLKLPKLSASESIFKDVWGLVTQPAIATFLVFATVAGIIDSFIIYFMFWHLEDVAAATGYMPQIKLIEGCVVAAECLAGELPFFFYSGKIIKKLGHVNCMSMCFFFYAIRLALISWIPNPWYLVGVELFFQGCTYALCYTCIVGYAASIAPPGTTATVQGLIAGMDDGLGFSIGSLIGGTCFASFGGRQSFKYFAVAAIITCVAHVVVRRSAPRSYHAPKEQVVTELKVLDSGKVDATS